MSLFFTSMIRIKAILFFMLFACFSAAAGKNFTFKNSDMELLVTWTTMPEGNAKLLIRVTPVTDILLPDNEGCFVLDSIAGSGKFRNIDCPIYNISALGAEYILYKRATNKTYEYTVPIAYSVSVPFHWNIFLLI